MSKKAQIGITGLLLIVLALFAFASEVAAQEPANPEPRFEKSKFFKSYGKGFVTSSATYWSGTFADIASSQGLRERNPILRNRQGGLSTGKTLAGAGAIYGVTLLIERKHPKAASVLRFIAGGIRWGTATRNWRLGNGKP